MPDATRRAARSGVFAGAVGILYAVFVLTPLGQRVDQSSQGVYAWLGPVAEAVGRLRTPLLAASLLAAAVSIVVLAMRRRIAAALSSAAVVAVVGPVDSLLRDVVLVRPDHGFEAGFDGNSYPSGHVAVTLAACAVVLVAGGARVRGWIAGVVCAIPILQAVSSMAAHAHRWSDVVGGALLAGCALQWIVGARPPRIARAFALPLSAVAAASVAVVAVVGAGAPIGGGLAGDLLRAAAYTAGAAAAALLALAGTPGVSGPPPPWSRPTTGRRRSATG